MDRIRKILAPTDLSDLSRIGVGSAIALARSQGAELIVLYVIAIADDWTSPYDQIVPVRRLFEESRRRLDEFLRANFAEALSGVTVRQEVEIGNPYRNIVARAADEKVDLIVMSTHGRTGLAHMLMGSVTEKVVGRAPCPVLSVPARAAHVGAAPEPAIAIA
ncbi:MAG TPA: universal stress protein [Candidatus Acidoferrales bacterium]|nr:universal stress protein [Candidatus Acidoferrales bacterium]